MEVEKSSEEIKKELHILIDSSTNNIVRNLSNIIESLKFDQSNVQNSGNIEINENMDSIANEINSLINIVNKMKCRELKYQEEEPKSDIYYNNKVIVDSLKKLTEIHENIENHLMELKKLPFTDIIKYICNKPNNDLNK